MTYLRRHALDLLGDAAVHIELVLVALALACAIALPLGVYAARSRRAGALVLGALGVVYTVPSLALFAVLVPALGIGRPTAVVALVAFAQMILVRGVVTGIRGVAPELVEAARGLGLSAGQSFWRVEWPQALPAILAAVRLATVTLISLATLAAWVDAGGLGVPIFYGLEHDAPERTVAGSLAAAALAIGADRLLRLAERAAAR